MNDCVFLSTQHVATASHPQEKCWSAARVGKVALILAGLLSCSRSATEVGMEPRPTPDTAVTEPAEPRRGFLFIARLSEQLGGLPSTTATTRLGVDGHLQRVVAGSGETLLELRDEHVDDATVLESWFEYGRSGFQDRSRRRGAEPGTMVVEALPAILRIRMLLPEGAFRYWEGDEATAPLRIRELLSDLDGLDGTPLEPVARDQAGAYIRVSWLTPEEARPLVRQGDLLDLDTGRTTLSATLEDALAAPFSLVPVAGSSNPLAPLQARFVPRRSVLFLSVRGRALQVRAPAFLAGTPDDKVHPFTATTPKEVPNR